MTRFHQRCDMKVLALHADLVMKSIVVIPLFSWPLLCHLQTLGAIDLVFHDSVRLVIVVGNADCKWCSLSFDGRPFVANLQSKRPFLNPPERGIKAPATDGASKFCLIDRFDKCTVAFVAYGGCIFHLFFNPQYSPCFETSFFFSIRLSVL